MSVRRGECKRFKPHPSQTIRLVHNTNIALVFVNGLCQSTAFQTNNLLCTTGELEIKTTRGEERCISFTRSVASGWGGGTSCTNKSFTFRFVCRVITWKRRERWQSLHTLQLTSREREREKWGECGRGRQGRFWFEVQLIGSNWTQLHMQWLLGQGLLVVIQKHFSQKGRVFLTACSKTEAPLYDKILNYWQFWGLFTTLCRRGLGF